MPCRPTSRRCGPSARSPEPQAGAAAMTTLRATAAPNRGAGPLAWLMEESLAGMARRRALLGYVFLLPTLLGILIFTAGPVVVSLGLSLYEWNVFDAPFFSGF